MNCQDYDHQLGDYSDGTLDATSRADVEVHLHACARCRAIVSDFEAIRSMARGLERPTPSPQVWQHIADVTARRSRRSWWSAGWQPALASAMAVLLATGLWWVGARLSDAAGSVNAGTALVAIDGLDAEQQGIFDTGEQGVEAHYAMAIARLEQVASAERSALDLETAYVLDAGLTVIDEAIVESRAALETQPENRLAQDSLVEALRHKVTVLQEMLTLTREMRNGGQDAAARILPELNR